MSWTDDRIATLKKMWKEGKSAAEIAKVLGKGVTRNAVIGKAHRMGLSGRPSPIKEPAGKKKPAAKKPAVEKVVKKEPAAPAPKKAAEKKTPPAPPARPAEKAAGKKPAAARKPVAGEVAPPHVMEKEDVPPGGGVPLIDLTERMCKWPIGDPRDDDFTFCGLATPQPGMSYCARHAAMAYQSSRRGSAAAAAAAAAAEEDDEDDVIDEDIADDEDAALDADEDIAAEE